MSVDGSAGARKPIWPLRQTVSQAKGAARGSTFYGIGSPSAKGTIGYYMKKGQPGPGFMHVPSSRDSRWFKQMTSEQKVRTIFNGKTQTYWKVKSTGVRNEAWDCRVYALAALHGLYAHGVLPPLARAGSAVPGKSSPAVDDEGTPVAAPRTNVERKAQRTPRRRGGGGFFGS
jgi:phage terminase large subunit GpA-like protein